MPVITLASGVILESGKTWHLIEESSREEIIMANSTPTVDLLVRQIIDYPQLKEALQARSSDSSSSNPEPSTQTAVSAVGTQEVSLSQSRGAVQTIQMTASAARGTTQQTPLRTPVEELRDIFH